MHLGYNRELQVIHNFSEPDKLPLLFQSFLDIELEQVNIWLRAELEAQRASSSVCLCSTATFQALGFNRSNVTWVRRIRKASR